MALYSDMNGFPESGFPVLADMEDRLTLNTLHYYPIKHLGYKLDVEGNNRLRGNLVLGGTLTGVTSIAMGGALSGATTVAASGDVNMSGGNLNITLGNINMTGFIGSVLQRIKKAWFTDLHIQNRPTCGNEDMVALVSDLQSIRGWNNSTQALSGVNPTFNPSAGLHFNLTVSTIPTITFEGLVDGMSGSISILNSSGVRMTFAGYTFHISQAVYWATNQVQLSGGTNTDKFKWSYDGSVVTINGTLDVKTT